MLAPLPTYISSLSRSKGDDGTCGVFCPTPLSYNYVLTPRASATSNMKFPGSADPLQLVPQPILATTDVLLFVSNLGFV